MSLFNVISMTYDTFSTDKFMFYLLTLGTVSGMIVVSTVLVRLLRIAFSNNGGE